MGPWRNALPRNPPCWIDDGSRFGWIKQWMGQGAFLTRRLSNVRGEFSLTALAYNMRRTINFIGVPTVIAAATD